MSTHVLENTVRTAGFDDNWIGSGPAEAGWSQIATPAPMMTQDGLSPTYPPSIYGGAAPMQGGGMMSQLMGIVSQLVGMLGQMLGLGQSQTPAASYAAMPSAGPQSSVSNATITSTGDPHLGVTGTLTNNTSLALQYTDMNPDPALATSDSFYGGFDVSTQTTQPDANGVTYNQSATVTTAFGANQVTFDNAGNATILQNGVPVSIASGQSVALGQGESVTDNGNSLVVTDSNSQGGTITTTMTQNGNGVDVSVNGQGLDLGGDVMQKALGLNGSQTGVA